MILPAFLASAALASAASAAPKRVPAYAAPPGGLTVEEIREYHRDQLERRHEMERAALRMSQKAELRARGLDDDDLDED
jgi:hypothetical protein